MVANVVILEISKWETLKRSRYNGLEKPLEISKICLFIADHSDSVITGKRVDDIYDPPSSHSHCLSYLRNLKQDVNQSMNQHGYQRLNDV